MKVNNGALLLVLPAEEGQWNRGRILHLGRAGSVQLHPGWTAASITTLNWFLPVCGFAPNFTRNAILWQNILNGKFSDFTFTLVVKTGCSVFVVCCENFYPSHAFAFEAILFNFWSLTVQSAPKHCFCAQKQESTGRIGQNVTILIKLKLGSNPPKLAPDIQFSFPQHWGEFSKPSVGNLVASLCQKWDRNRELSFK